MKEEKTDSAGPKFFQVGDILIGTQELTGRFQGRYRVSFSETGNHMKVSGKSPLEVVSKINKDYDAFRRVCVEMTLPGPVISNHKPK